jgi:hypothetical protein
LGALLSVGATGFLLGASPAGEDYAAHLGWAPTDLLNRDSLGGVGDAQATFDGRTLVISGVFKDMASPAIAAHLYFGVASGARGPKIAELQVTKAVSGTVSGSVALTSAQAEGLRAGKLYVQIDSVKMPSGNLWGWLWPPNGQLRQLQS